MKKKLTIYFDHSATTPVGKDVIRQMLPYFHEKFGNASSLHFFGQAAKEAVEKARNTAALFFGANLGEIIFTSGATESNNLAIKGVVEKYHTNRTTKDIPHIITTSFEHKSVLDVCVRLEQEGLAKVTYIKPDNEGMIAIADINKAMSENTILVSVMYVNNEIGTVQPIAKIGKLIAFFNQKSKRRHKTLFHTDATQAINYFNSDIKELGVDLLSMSGHKIYGPKGIGLLYVKNGTPIRRILDGGSHESGLRPGTLNVPLIVGLESAFKLAQKNKTRDIKKITNLRNYLIKRVLKEIKGTSLNGSSENRSPNNANISFDNVEGESLILMLDREGIACSTGSACTSDNLKASHVLLAMGLSHEQAHGSLRFTLGKDNTKHEIDYMIIKLKKILEKLREISGQVLDEYYSNSK